MPKGFHLKKEIKLKNWKTGKIFSFDSLTQASKKFNIPLQSISDLKTGRRNWAGDFCRINENYCPKSKIQIKDLKIEKILEFPSLKNASKKLKIGIHSIKRILKEPSYRRKNYGNISYPYKIPNIIQKFNKTKIPVFNTQELAERLKISCRKAYYFLNEKRIPYNLQWELEGFRDYKYLIRHSPTGNIHRAMSLKQFAEIRGMNPYDFYSRKNTGYEIISG